MEYDDLPDGAAEESSKKAGKEDEDEDEEGEEEQDEEEENGKGKGKRRVRGKSRKAMGAALPSNASYYDRDVKVMIKWAKEFANARIVNKNAYFSTMTDSDLLAKEGAHCWKLAMEGPGHALLELEQKRIGCKHIPLTHCNLR